MNRRLYCCIAALGLGLSASLASAQAVPTTNPAEVPHITTGTRGSSAITPEQKAEIDANVGAQVTILTTGTPAARTAAKALIIAEAPGTAGGLTPQYLDAYAASLDQHIIAALKAKPSLAVRINLGVIAAKVAANTQSFQLENSALALMQDDAEAVVLWGMRTAKHVLPYSIKVKVGKNAMLPLIITVGNKYPGPVLTEAYEALSLSPMNINQPANAKAAQVEIKTVIPFMQTMLNTRVQGYANGIVKEPGVDPIGTNFLSSPNVWSAQTPTQKKDTLKLFHDFLSKVGPLYVVQNDELLNVIKRLGGAVAVTVSTDKLDDTVVQQASKVSKLGPTDAPPKVSAEIATLVSGIEQMTFMQTPAAQGGAATKPSSGSSPASDIAVIK